MAEFLPGYESSAWYGIGGAEGHAGGDRRSPQPEVNAGLADPTLKARFTDLSAVVVPGSPADFGKLLAEETEKWGKVVKFAGIKAD